MQKKSKENQRATAGAYRFGEFDLYPSERQLHCREAPVRIGPKAFDALLLLVSNAERLVRHDQLIEALWPDTFVTDANLTNVIVSLRKILGREAIQTVSKFGYRFCIPVVGEPGVDQATYATFVRAKQLATVKSLDAMSQARDLFSVCVAADPGFAEAWAWLGRCARFLEKFKRDALTNRELAQAALRRALAINPHLACAHHFYTQLQVDLGGSRDAVVRLARRVVERGDEPESYAGLVHALRYCGLLDESLAAHTRATELDPTIATSVHHTHFLRCEYEATLETSGNTRFYLDTAAWAAIGESARAIALLKARLASGQFSPLMAGMMESLLATLENRRADAIRIMEANGVEREPEMTFYFARHHAMLGCRSETMGMLQRARSEGYASSWALERDPAFEALRRLPEFQQEIDEAHRLETEARRELEQTGAHLRLAVGSRQAT
jgi:DNA-binding winged helix-turn-helix (wHTH) protein